MNKLSFAFSPYYKFNCDPTLVKTILEELEQLKELDPKNQVSNSNNNVLVNNIENEYYYQPDLFDWFDDCILQVKQDLKIQSGVELPIVACWANKTKKFQGHHHHHHPNSFLSGILYLTSHTSGITHFYRDNYWTENFSHMWGIFEVENIMEHKIAPEAGTLVIFPSHVRHKVSGLTSSETRYSISFNTWPNGRHNNSLSSKLEITAKSIRDYVKESK